MGGCKWGILLAGRKMVMTSILTTLALAWDWGLPLQVPLGILLQKPVLPYVLANWRAAEVVLLTLHLWLSDH